MMEIYTSRSETETEKIGEALAKQLYDQHIPYAFVALFGEMGVGKTAFTRGFCRALGIAGVHSPTYTVVNTYEDGDYPGFHFDMYRIESEDDLDSIGFYDYLDRPGICLVEWSENIPYALPDRWVRVEICKCSPDAPDTREITITPMGGHASV